MKKAPEEESGTSTPNGLFQTINELKRLMDYFKRPH